MAASVIAAVIERYEGLPVNGLAKIWFDEAPLKDGAGNPVRPPYVVLHDDSTDGSQDLEYYRWEDTKLRFEVWAPNLAEVDAIVLGLRFGGQGHRDRAGMDNADALTIAGQDFKACIWQGEQRFVERSRGADAKAVHRCRVRYEVSCQRTG